MKDKLTMILTTVKVLVSMLITYLVLFKGDAGALVYNIGAFLVGGNFIVGLSSIAIATLFYVVAMYNLTVNCTSLKILKQFLIIFDGTLVAINLILGCFIVSVFNQMPFDDAISKFTVLTTGAAVVYYLGSLFITLLISKLQSNLQDNTLFNLGENNNPFTFTGRITRKAYLITKFSMSAIFLSAISLVNVESAFTLRALITLVTFAVGLFAASKRLRDVQWSQLLLIIWAIPFLGLLVGVPLLLIGSKQDNK